MTAGEATRIIREHIIAYEKSGDLKSAVELFRASESIFQARQREFRDLPIECKCEIWRERGVSEEIIKEARLNGRNFGAGDSTGHFQPGGHHVVTIISTNRAMGPLGGKERNSTKTNERKNTSTREINT